MQGNNRRRKDADGNPTTEMYRQEKMSPREYAPVIVPANGLAALWHHSDDEWECMHVVAHVISRDGQGMPNLAQVVLIDGDTGQFPTHTATPRCGTEKCPYVEQKRQGAFKRRVSGGAA